jgi:uncharacterized iron-regulated membrane protein
MKKIFYQLHLWLGLVSGLLVFIIALTGALYAFQEEIGNIVSYKHVEEQNVRFLPPSKLESIAEAALPGKELHAIKYNGRKKAAEAIFYGYEPSYYNIVYLNPYNGEVLKEKDMQKDFFRFIITGHFYLWLPPKIGQPLVAWSTLVFVVITISGLIIWIPKKRKQLKNRVWFRWDKSTKWPRINFDLHVVGGLYTTVFALIFALTGLVWGFQWFANGYYKLVGGEKSLDYSDVSPIKSSEDRIAPITPIDSVWHLMEKEYPDYGAIEVHPTHTDSSLIAANATEKVGKYWKTDYRYFDQHTLQEVKQENIYGRLKDANTGEKLFRMNYDIHTGAILGLPGKIVAFIMSLLIASLPVTGFIMWWRKKRKKKN